MRGFCYMRVLLNIIVLYWNARTTQIKICDKTFLFHSALSVLSVVLVRFLSGFALIALSMLCFMSLISRTAAGNGVWLDVLCVAPLLIHGAVAWLASTFEAFQTVRLPGTSTANWSRSRHRRRRFPRLCEPCPPASRLAYAVGPSSNVSPSSRRVDGDKRLVRWSLGCTPDVDRTVTGVTSGVFCWR